MIQTYFVLWKVISTQTQRLSETWGTKRTNFQITKHVLGIAKCGTVHSSKLRKSCCMKKLHQKIMSCNFAEKKYFFDRSKYNNRTSPKFQKCYRLSPIDLCEKSYPDFSRVGVFNFWTQFILTLYTKFESKILSITCHKFADFSKIERDRKAWRTDGRTDARTSIFLALPTPKAPSGQ